MTVAAAFAKRSPKHSLDPQAATEDRDLAARAANGDRAAFADLVATHYDRIYRFAYRFVGSATDAEDVAQDSVIKLARSIEQYQGQAAFTSWLFRIVLSVAHDHLRKQSRHQRGTQPLSDAEQALTSPENHWNEESHSSETAALWTAVRALPPKQRDAMLLVYGQELSHAEAAIIMGCKEVTVSSHLHDGRKRLKRMMSDD